MRDLTGLWPGTAEPMEDKGISEKRSKKFHMVCLSDNIPELTAIANDISYDEIYRFPLKNNLKANDLALVGHLYQLMIKDDRFEVELVLLEETAREEFQMVTAREFLEQNNIEYSLFEEFDVEQFQPHIVFIQTPYDAGHRQKEHWSASFKSHGYRVIYIPYGVEISDTLDSHSMHFRQHVVVNSWRVYTFSNLMKRDYWKYCYNRGAVRALGLPRFDSLYLKDNL